MHLHDIQSCNQITDRINVIVRASLAEVLFVNYKMSEKSQNKRYSKEINQIPRTYSIGISCIKMHKFFVPTIAVAIREEMVFITVFFILVCFIENFIAKFHKSLADNKMIQA